MTPIRPSSYSTLVIRTQTLRRRLAEAARALAIGHPESLNGFEGSVADLCALARAVPYENRAHAAQALMDLEGDIDAYSLVLRGWIRSTPSRSPES